jgi:(S)-2-hydroxyglutarate dehydrogenase
MTSTTRAGGRNRLGVIGAGILGLTVARELQQRLPGTEVVVLEKEDGLATHQTGRNSGVVHAGIYYPPGSLKARLCIEGGRLLREFCHNESLPYEECGKLVVALNDEEARRLDNLRTRAVANGVADVALLGPDEFNAIEPEVAGVRALYSPHTGIVDFGAVTRRLAEQVELADGTIHLDTTVKAIRPRADKVEVLTDRGIAAVDGLVNCGGLYADRLAQLAGDDAAPKIVPFRGEYLRLVPDRRHLVRGLIYPVPDPRLPFLGVHLTKRVDGEVLVGPNAVMALAREGYRWGRISVADLLDSARWAGTWRLASQHWRTGVTEVVRSLARSRFVAEARRYVPALGNDDVVAGPCGVRAQALDRDGSLVDDFRISWCGRVINVRNAPSPAATSAFAIARHLVDQVVETLPARTH